jgi:hypothetical protein
MIGRKGNGVAVLVDQSIHDFVTVWHVSEQIQAIWLKCAGQVFNVPGNVALGAVYLNPKTDKRSNSDITESFEHFFDEATTASLNFTNVLIMGDFNAHIVISLSLPTSTTTFKMTSSAYNMLVALAANR